MAGNTMQGRRISEKEAKEAGGFYFPLDAAGEGAYYGPVEGYTGDKTAVFYLLPGSRSEGASLAHRSVRHVTSPPHTFHEEDDGSLTIRASILHEDGWHGHLTRGVWTY